VSPLQSFFTSFDESVMIDINMFERVFVINLKSRPERWEDFLKRLPKDWPFRTPERFIGVDGKLVPPPPWWRSGQGGWGCHRTHTRILEECLNNNVNSVLVCEDDAVFVENFTEKVAAYINHLPND
jgi:GR25 family glycosyltransferase involved in LPS biosynthesis